MYDKERIEKRKLLQKKSYKNYCLFLQKKIEYLNEEIDFLNRAIASDHEEEEELRREIKSFYDLKDKRDSLSSKLYYYSTRI